MDGYQSLEVMRGMLLHCVAALSEVVEGAGWQDEAVLAGQWQPLFGKESVVGALAKLVSLHKSLMEQEQQVMLMAERGAAGPVTEVLSDADWQVLALCLEARGSGGGSGGALDAPALDGRGGVLAEQMQQSGLMGEDGVLHEEG